MTKVFDFGARWSRWNFASKPSCGRANNEPAKARGNGRVENSRGRRTSLPTSLGRKDRRVPHLGVVLAAWDPTAAAESVDLVLERLRGLKGVQWSMVVVANNKAVAPALTRVRGEYRLVSGSNREAEFSAYDEGTPSPGGRDRDGARRVGYRERPTSVLQSRLSLGRHPTVVQFASSVPIAAGNIDFLPHYFHLRGQKFRYYIRANYILVSSAAIDRVGSLCAVSANDYALEVPIAFPGQDWPLSAWLEPELGESLRVFDSAGWGALDSVRNH